MIKKGKLLGIGLLLNLISLSVYSQAEDELGTWFVYNEYFNINPKVQVFFESQYRSYEVFKNPETFFVRPYFNYNVTKQLQTGIGIEYHRAWTFDEDPDQKVATNEIRYTLQAIMSQNVDRVVFQHRYRYEFRDVDKDFLQRMRYRFQVTVPLNNKKLQEGTVFINASNEFMIDTYPQLKLSQNRAYGALGYQFTNHLNIQVGYLAVSRTEATSSRIVFFLAHKFYFYE